MKFIPLLFILFTFVSLKGEMLNNIDYTIDVRENYINPFPSISKNYFGIVNKDSLLYRVEDIAKRYEEMAKLDSSGNFMIISSDFMGEEFYPDEVITLEDYKKKRLEYSRKKQWYKKISSSIGKAFESSGSEEISIDIPIKIKSKNFHRIFGGNRIGLRLRGNMKFNLTGKKSYNNSNDAETSDFSFSPDTEMNISVKGKVGEKVTVNIAQDTENMDFENQISIIYDGDSDEIVQKLEAGNISLNLPGTNFVSGNGGNHKGLFGLKTQLKIGKINSTFVASLEKGEKNELKINGNQKSLRTKKIYTYDFERNLYFYLDNVFREHSATHFEDKKIGGINQMPASNYSIDQGSFRLFTTNMSYKGNIIKGEVYDTRSDFEDPSIVESPQNLKEVDESDYVLDSQLGYIMLKTSTILSSGSKIAVAFDMTDISNSQEIPVGNATPSLQVVKVITIGSYNSKVTDRWHDLEWKNVYSLDGSDIDLETFEMNILEYGNSKSDKFQDVYDIVKQNSNDKEVSSIFLRNDLGHFIFPALKPFYPDSLEYYETTLGKQYSPSVDTLLFDSGIYENISSNNKTSKMELEFKFRSKSSSHSLGFNVLEGSETVKSGAKTLKRDIDYIIDYTTGELTILQPEVYKDVDITYESASIFQLDKKVLMGNRTEFRFNEKSFIGLTTMYLSRTTKDDKVYLGQEPFENFIWDVNGRYSDDLPFLTTGIDKLPFIETEVKSSFSIEGEFAQIIPNPNTKGSAYLDDFESSDRTRSLGMSYYLWHKSSTPDQYLEGKYNLNDNVVNIGEQNIDPIYFLQPGATSYSREGTGFYWYNPNEDDRLEKQDIYDDVEGKEAIEKVNSLNFVFKPGGIAEALDREIDLEDSWGGVMRYIPGSYQDLTEMKYIEFLVKSGSPVDMYIDLGDINEDVIPNGIINSEDLLTNEDGETKDGYNNGLLDKRDKEDVGLDMVHNYNIKNPSDTEMNSLDPEDLNGFETYYYHSYDDRPTTSNNIMSNPKSDIDIDYWQMNKTEGNGRLDTEDLNFNGVLDKESNFFRYKIRLKGESEFIVSESNGFVKYRIPIDVNKNSEATIVNGAPDLSEIKYVRLWFSNFEPTGQNNSVEITFIDIDFVGNEWVAEGKSRKFIEPKVINNKDNPDQYTPPPSVSLSKDDEGNVEKEQSLQISWNFDISEDPEQAFLRKEYKKGESFFLYKKLEMEIHGGDGVGNKPWPSPDESDLYFVYRFGRDSANYYEYSSELVEGWKNDFISNKMVIDLKDLPEIKLDTNRVDYTVKTGITTYHKYSETDSLKRSLAVLGEPSLSNIKYYEVGIVDSTFGTSVGTLNQNEIWIDELKLVDVEKNISTAKRISGTITFADLGSVSSSFKMVDSDFHDILKNRGSLNNNQNFSLNANIKLNKFFPDRWKLSMPIDYAYKSDKSTPKFIDNTDILTPEKNVHDSIITKTTVHSFNYRFSKDSKSENLISDYTIDRLVYKGGSDFTKSSTPVYSSIDKKSFSNSLSYNFDFPSKYISIPYMWWAKNIGFLKKYSKEKFKPIPSDFTASISTMQSISTSIRRNKKDKPTTNNSFIISRKLSTDYKPFSFLDFNYEIKLKSNMYLERVKLDTTVLAYDILDVSKDYIDILKLDFGELDNLRSDLKANTKFNLTKYLTNSFSYNSSYDWNAKLNSPGIGRSHKNDRTFNYRTTLKNKKIFSDLADFFHSDEPITNKSNDEKEREQKVEEKKERSRTGVGRNRNKKRNLKKSSKNKSDYKEDKSEFTTENFFKFLSKNLGNVTYNFGINRTNTTSKVATFDKAPWDYWFGLSSKPKGSEFNSSETTYGWSGQYNWKIGTTLKLMDNINLGNLSYSKSHDFSYSASRYSGAMKWTSFGLPMGLSTNENPGDNGKFGIAIPDYSLTIKGIEKLLKNTEDLFSSIEISHSKTGSQTEKWVGNNIDGYIFYTGEPNVKDRRVESKRWDLSFSPLVRLSLGFENGLMIKAGTSYGFTMEERYQYDKEKKKSIIKSGNRAFDYGFDLTASYSQEGGFNIPFNFWPFNGKRVENNIDYSLSYGLNFRDTYELSQEKKLYLNSSIKESITSTLSPKIKYRFDKNLNGELTYSYSSTTNKGSSIIETSNHELRLSMIYKFTGR
ncbi:MAG: cell surface protein SprA [Candidatus Cloacimonadota bacterium]|nr:MAG: cell surface protein SprA [Candidatus Cloacimonadota bacterium]PIE78063.1 MAG: cell surface protein SprA [Candidatus Delongbacteria bacterium]